MTFATTLYQSGGNTTGIIVPSEVIESFGAGKKPPVIVTINGHSWRSTVAVMSGDFMVGVSADNRQKAGVKGGDAIEVTLMLDTEPRIVEVPDDFRLALDGDPAASAFYESLSPSHKKRHITVIEEAKSPETRRRRIEKAIEMLREGKK